MPPTHPDIPFASAVMPDGFPARIRGDHPRLFFNQELWPGVKARALGPASDYYDALRKKVDGYPAEPEGSSGGPVFEREEVVGGKTYRMLDAEPSTEWGVQAAETAFVYLMTGDRKYLEKARRMLEVSIEVYHECYRERRVANWYSVTRVCALAAYDWIFNDLTPEERERIIVPFLRHIEDVRPGPGKPAIHGINSSGYNTGFYGVLNLPWFAGLAACNDGVADELAEKFLKLGWQHYSETLNFRRDIAGDDGGLASATVCYAMGAYPWSDFNLFYTWKSAVGEDLAPSWPYLAHYPIWVMWNWIPADDHPKEFGSGDTYHGTNDLRTYSQYEHMSQIMHFHGSTHPDCTALASHIRDIVPEKRFTLTYPFYPFLVTDMESSPPSKSPEGSRVFARHFAGLGQISMRSGSGPDDTYCLFSVGSKAPNHQHYDENNFIIYRKGFLALDSGTRGSSKDFNLRHYYAQTVAHNCMLIHMPDEPPAPYWGPEFEGPEGQTNYGGMYRETGGEAVAFETNQFFTYVAGDATACYRAEKCRLSLRQFVFVMPDLFVICDRVVSTGPEYGKAWLLHTQTEPEISDGSFRADEGDGRLFCRTLFPRDAVPEKIGGPGKEFWANGRNWELNDDLKRQNEKEMEETGKPPLLGNWRIEVTPGAPRTEDTFLHVIQVGDQNLAEMAETQLIEEEGRVGVSIQCDGLSGRVMFGISGPASGHIVFAADGRALVDQPLAQEIMPQSGLAEPEEVTDEGP